MHSSKNGGAMAVLGFAGWSGAGKTTLLTAVLPGLVGRGLRVSTIKHAHHDFDIDRPGKDSFRHREAGASEVLIGSGRRFALMHEYRDEAEAGLDALLARLSPVDLVLVEGFKYEPIPKIEVWRAVSGKPMLQPEDPRIIAVAGDRPVAGLPVPWLDAGAPETVVAFIADWLDGLAAGKRRGAAE